MTIAAQVRPIERPHWLRCVSSWTPGRPFSLARTCVFAWPSARATAHLGPGVCQEFRTCKLPLGHAYGVDEFTLKSARVAERSTGTEFRHRPAIVIQRHKHCDCHSYGTRRNDVWCHRHRCVLIPTVANMLSTVARTSSAIVPGTIPRRCFVHGNCHRVSQRICPGKFNGAKHQQKHDRCCDGKFHSRCTFTSSKHCFHVYLPNGEAHWAQIGVPLFSKHDR